MRNLIRRLGSIFYICSILGREESLDGGGLLSELDPIDLFCYNISSDRADDCVDSYTFISLIPLLNGTI